MEISNKKFKKEQKQAEKTYKNIGNVHCPYLKEKVAFNSKGIQHIKFKRRHQARSKNDQYTRLRFLFLAEKVISLSHTLQGYQEKNEMTRNKENKRWLHIMKSVEYFEFVAVMQEVRVRIIIKKENDGYPFFWSIIPFWRMSNRQARLLYSGNPNED